MPFCPKCNAFLVHREGELLCPMCGKASKGKTEETVVRSEVEDNEMLILEDGLTLPKTRISCPKCEHKEAYWMIRQTRAADEPETRIYRCVKCTHTWREY